MTDETRRAIIDALGLSQHAGGKLVEALDARYRRPPAAEPDVTELPGPVLWGVWCTPIPTPSGRKADWLEESKPDRAKPDYVFRATNEAIAAELNARTHAKHWHYEARPVLADGSPGPVPNVCTKCGVNFHDTAYATNGCFHTHYGESTGFSKAAVDAILQRPNDTIRARFEAPSPGVPVVGAHPTEDSLRAGCACSACKVKVAVDSLIRQPPASAVSVEEHCLGNDCADKAACECLCPKCVPARSIVPGEER